MAVIDVDKIETEVFARLRQLIIDNLPSYEHNAVQQNYSLVAEYPSTNPKFPLIVLNSANVKLALINLDGSGEDYELQVEFDYYANEKHGKKAVEIGFQSLRSTFIKNLPSLNSKDGLLPMQDFWENSNISIFQDGNHLLNTTSSLVKFKLR